MHIISECSGGLVFQKSVECKICVGKQSVATYGLNMAWNLNVLLEEKICGVHYCILVYLSFQVRLFSSKWQILRQPVNFWERVIVSVFLLHWVLFVSEEFCCLKGVVEVKHAIFFPGL